LKALFLVRHAKSSWNDPLLPDADRPLSPRGRRAARKMGRRLAKQQLDPDLMVSSPAVRALKTARIMARRIGYPRRAIRVNPRVYACTAEELLRAIGSLDDRVRTVMLFGHNPEISSLAQRFCAAITPMPTCGVARLTFDIESWATIATSAPIETDFEYPKRGRK
jgi:phosphohistidine phosphatase